MGEYYTIVFIYHCSFIDSSVDGHLGSLYNLTAVDSAAAKIGVHVSLLSVFLLPLGQYLVLRLLDHRVVLFLIFSRNLYFGLCSGCPSLYYHQQWERVSLSPHPCQYLLYLVLLILAIVTDVRWNLIVVLIFIALMMSDVEHLYFCLLAIYMSALGKCLFMFPDFLIGLLILVLSFINSS